MRPTPPVTEKFRIRPSVYHEFIQSGPFPVAQGYRLARKNFKQMMEITKLWSPEVPKGFDLPTVERAVEMVLDLLEPQLGQARIQMMDELRIPVGTSPGPLGQLLGVRDKVEALTKYDYLVREFFETAHEDLIMPLFSEVQKVDEILPLDKINIGKYRTFIIPDFVVWASMTMMFYDMDSHLKNSQYFGVGYKFSNGFTELIRYMKNGQSFSSEDLNQYDRSLWILFAYVVICVRQEGYKPAYQQYADRVPYYVFLSFMNVRRLPNGMLVFKEDGVSSGVPTTSTDGCICHLFADCYVWLRNQFDPPSFFNIVFPKYYSDDVIRATAKCYEGDTFLSTMTRYYAELGLKVKPFEPSDSLEGQQFLGCTFRVVESRLVPVYEETDKILASLFQPKGKYTLDEEFGRALSFYQETYWNLDLRQHCLEYLRFLKARGAPGTIPKRTAMLERWFGYE